MNDREKWRERVKDIGASGMTWWWWWWWWWHNSVLPCIKIHSYFPVTLFVAIHRTSYVLFLMFVTWSIHKILLLPIFVLCFFFVFCVFVYCLSFSYFFWSFGLFYVEILEVKIPDIAVNPSLSYLPTPPLGQDMTQGQFLSGV